MCQIEKADTVAARLGRLERQNRRLRMFCILGLVGYAGFAMVYVASQTAYGGKAPTKFTHGIIKARGLVIEDESGAKRASLGPGGLTISDGQRVRISLGLSSHWPPSQQNVRLQMYDEKGEECLSATVEKEMGVEIRLQNPATGYQTRIVSAAPLSEDVVRQMPEKETRYFLAGLETSKMTKMPMKGLGEQWIPISKTTVGIERYYDTESESPEKEDNSLLCLQDGRKLLQASLRFGKGPSLRLEQDGPEGAIDLSADEYFSGFTLWKGQHIPLSQLSPESKEMAAKDEKGAHLLIGAVKMGYGYDGPILEGIAVDNNPARLRTVWRMP